MGLSSLKTWGMKIGIEAQRVYRRNKHGIDIVALELIKNLQRIDRHNSYVIFVKPDEDTDCLPKAPNFKIVELTSIFGYAGWEQFELPRAALKEGCDVLHCTGNTGPLFCKVPLVATLHDIIYLENLGTLKKGGTWYHKLGNLYRRYAVPPMIRKSKKIITVSNAEKERIVSYFGFADNRLTTIYNGVGTHFKKMGDIEELNRAKEEFSLPDDFFLFLGNPHPKKNTKGVLKAFNEFCKSSPFEFKLVLLDYSEEWLQKLLRQIDAPELRSKIHVTGYVPNIKLPAIINQCSVFLYPSLRESFGIPILEGMACGVPVITSNTSSMLEIAGSEAAFIVNPFDTVAIANAIQSLIEDKVLAKVLAEKGIARAKQFSWENMAKNVLDIYREVLQ